MDGWLAVDDAARQLGVSKRRVQALIAEGVLAAERIGNRWHLPARTVRDYQRNSTLRRGRPISSASSWQLIGGLPQRPIALRDLDAFRRAVRPRAVHHSWYVHPALLARLVADSRTMASGTVAASEWAPIDPDPPVDVYIRAGDVNELTRDYRAHETFDGNVRAHIVDDSMWPFTEDREVSRWLVWLDLADADVRAADAVLDQLIGGRAT